MDGKNLFDGLLNIASALIPAAPRQAKPGTKPAKAAAKPLQFGATGSRGGGSSGPPVAPSCCIAKRAQQASSVGSGKLPPVRKP